MDWELLNLTTGFFTGELNYENSWVPIVSWILLGMILLAFRYSIKGNPTQEKKWSNLDFISKVIYSSITAVLLFVLSVEIGFAFLFVYQMITNRTGDLMPSQIWLLIIGVIYFIIISWNSKKYEFKNSLKLFYSKSFITTIFLPIFYSFLMILFMIVSPARDFWMIITIPFYLLIFYILKMIYFGKNIIKQAKKDWNKVINLF